MGSYIQILFLNIKEAHLMVCNQGADVVQVQNTHVSLKRMSI